MHNSTPFVSIVINCLNGEKYLKECIDSIFAQTYQNWEIIFWDNKSTDNTAEIAKAYGDKVKYFCSEKTVPLGWARNLALKKSSGDLIALLDSDDIWLANRLERQINVFWDSHYAICYAGLEEITASGEHIRNVLPHSKSGNLFSVLLNQFDVNISTLLIRKEVLENNNFEFDKSIVASEEYNLFMRMAVKHEFCTIPEVLAKWRVHDSLTNKAISKWADEREYTLKQIENENPGIEILHKTAFKEAYTRAIYYRCRYLISQNQTSKARKTLRKTIFFSPKYFILNIILLFPIQLWKLLHQPELKSKLTSKILEFSNKQR